MLEAYCDAFFKNVLISNLFGAIPEVIICFFEEVSLVMFSLVVCFVPMNQEIVLIEALDSTVVDVAATGVSIAVCAKLTEDNINITKTIIILIAFEVVFLVVFISCVLLCLYMTNLWQHLRLLKLLR
jgi:hypothetical protein